MKKIYKSLISILIISMLAIVGIAAKPIPPNAEQIQDQRLTNLEINDSNQDANNSAQQNWISGLFEGLQEANKQLALIGNRVLNLENDPYPAIYSSDFKYVTQIHSVTKTEINNLTINLPKDAVAYIESNGNFYNSVSCSQVTLEIDGIQRVLPPVNSYVYYCGQEYDSGFQTATTRYLTAGQHNIKIYVTMDAAMGDPGASTAGALAEITVMAFDKNKGNIQNPNTIPAQKR